MPSVKTVLKMGTKVKISALAHPEYDSANRRRWVKYWHEGEGYYVGYTYKLSVKLFRVKLHPRQNDKFAFPADVKEVNIA